jgi:hypothetical protein
MVICLAIACFIYYEKKIDACNSNPFTYGAKVLEKSYGYEFIGSGYFLTPITIKSPRIFFTSSNYSIEI